MGAARGIRARPVAQTQQLTPRQLVARALRDFPVVGTTPLLVIHGWKDEPVVTEHKGHKIVTVTATITLKIRGRLVEVTEPGDDPADVSETETLQGPTTSTAIQIPAD